MATTGDKFIAAAVLGLGKGIFEGIDKREQRALRMKELELKEKEFEARASDRLENQEFKQQQELRREREFTIRQGELNEERDFRRTVTTASLGLRAGKTTSDIQKARAGRETANRKRISKISGELTKLGTKRNRLDSRIKRITKETPRKEQIRRDIELLDNQKEALEREQESLAQPTPSPSRVEAPEPRGVTFEAAQSEEEVFDMLDSLEKEGAAAGSQTELLLRARKRIAELKSGQ